MPSDPRPRPARAQGGPRRPRLHHRGPSLSGGEFFGHEKGAFTGAGTARDGAFALADGGTLFLDEVGELRLDLQAELLRVLQERAYKRVGGSRWQTTDFRLVCATHRDLPRMVGTGEFRADLYHRLAANLVRLPRLGDRPGDVLPLARAFLTEQLGAVPPFDRAVERFLHERAYPGNVRELRQLMARIAVRYCGEGPLTIGTVPVDDRPATRTDVPDTVAEPRRPGGLVEEAVREGLPLGRIKDLVRDAAISLVFAEEQAEDPRSAVRRTAQRLDVSERLVQQWRHDRRSAGTDPAGGPP